MDMSNWLFQIWNFFKIIHFYQTKGNLASTGSAVGHSNYYTYQIIFLNSLAFRLVENNPNVQFLSGWVQAPSVELPRKEPRFFGDFRENFQFV